MQIGAALLGNLDDEMRKGRSHVARAARTAIVGTAQGLQSKLRQDFASSRLARGAELQKTWRVRFYPAGAKETLNPAALVYSTMPQVTMAFEKGATVTVNGKKGALVPNAAVWGEGRVRRPSGRASKSVSTFDVALRRYGGLQWIPTPGNDDLVGVFVAKLDKGLSRTGKRRKAGVRALRKGEYDREVVFWVIHEPRLPRLLRGDVIRRRTERDAPDEIARRFIAAFERDQGGVQARLTGPEM
ncbi:DUF6441 family protein [Brevundimonas sp.]|uniref:DUF6441 family protein n=1 Tax=Brevundimonas sp. TaxID=1871086 RepID=UPI002D6D7720|nr:DUF6441 family protein [Brevundimonas sp.]HYD26973.1 DUF6441 family protein [Brevundimonas sp.]